MNMTLELNVIDYSWTRQRDYNGWKVVNRPFWLKNANQSGVKTKDQWNDSSILSIYKCWWFCAFHPVAFAMSCILIMRSSPAANYYSKFYFTTEFRFWNLESWVLTPREIYNLIIELNSTVRIYFEWGAVHSKEMFLKSLFPFLL